MILVVDGWEYWWIGGIETKNTPFHHITTPNKTTPHRQFIPPHFNTPHHTTLYHATHHTTPHHSTPHNATPHHTTPHYSTLHHITPHHNISHHTTPHHTTPQHLVSVTHLPGKRPFGHNQVSVHVDTVCHLHTTTSLPVLSEVGGGSEE